MTSCAGIPMVDADHFQCRCCGDVIRLRDGDEWHATPGGTCWPCGLGFCNEDCPNYQPSAEEAQLTEADIEQWKLEDRIGGPCPECGERGACAYDAEGRPMVHVQTEEDGDGLG